MNQPSKLKKSKEKDNSSIYFLRINLICSPKTPKSARGRGGRRSVLIINLKQKKGIVQQVYRTTLIIESCITFEKSCNFILLFSLIGGR